MKTSQRIAFDINKVEIGTKIITRDGHSGRIDSIDLEKLDYPVSAIIELDGKEIPFIFTKEGRSHSDYTDSIFDLFLEEEKIENQESIQSEKQDKDEVNRPQSKDNIPNRAIVFKDFNSDEGFYRIQIDYLSKKQIEELEQIVKDWNKQKHIDKIEPKFKVGDFIVNKYCIGKVVTIIDDAYLLSTGQSIPFSCDNTHLWTIRDAKPGDILFHSDTASNGIFIFKEIAQDGEVVCYCDYDSEDGFCFFEEYHTCCRADDKILYIATEKQRNFLFQKMKEAGYQWDAEDKELKQINKEVKTRLMTNQELSWWLREHPEEHREYCIEGETCVCFNYHYNSGNSNKEVDEYIRIRKNGGEWIIPFIDV